MPVQTSRTEFGRIHPPDERWLARALPEPAVEAELPIVDTHVHFWHSSDDHRYFVEDYARDIADSGHDVAASVYVECGSMYRAAGPAEFRCVGETEFAVGMSAVGASGRYTTSRVADRIVSFADLALGDRLGDVLDAHLAAANGRLAGIRHRAKWDPQPAVRGLWAAGGPGLYLEPQFQRGLRQVAKRGLSFDASVFHPQIPDVTALARAVPEANVVLIHSGSPVGHCGYAGRAAEVHGTWLDAMAELATLPNVVVKMGGILMPLANFDFGVESRPPTSEELAQLWRPYIEPCVELFGAERCMVASNFPVDKAGFGYGTVWNMFKRITAGYSDNEKRAIYTGTAERIYGISR